VVPKEIELNNDSSVALPRAQSEPRPGIKQRLETNQEGRICIGSPAYLNLPEPYVPVPDIEEQIEPKLYFEGIKSHLGEKLNDRVMAQRYVDDHNLTYKMKHTHWNNVPPCIRDMFQSLVDYNIQQEINSKTRKATENERMLQL
jgi:hypothetical protein